MTTVEIETLASSGNLAGADLNVMMTLRRVVVPQFFQDVGDARWRRKNTTISVLANTRNYDLPTDFFQIIEAYFPPATAGNVNPTVDRLQYIGEDPDAVNRAENATTAARPTGYNLIAGSSNPKAIRFNVPPDTAYTLYYTYLLRTFFADNTTSVNLSLTIPEDFQIPLIYGLRAQILFDRFGQRDSRFNAEMARYDKAIESVKEHPDAARRNFVQRVN